MLDDNELVCAKCPYYYLCAERESCGAGALPPYKPGEKCRRKHVVQAALFDGRHETPPYITEAFWHGGVSDVNDFLQLESHANRWIREHFDDEGGMLVLYVTGLSQALLAVVKACFRRGIHLTCMHHDKETRSYKRQIVF